QNIQLVKDINTIPEKGSEIRGLSISNGKIFFKAEDDTSEVEVWSSDGTASGCTNISYQPNPTDRSIRDEAHQFYELNGDTYFVDFERLYTTDGTFAGTQMVSNIKVTRVLGIFLNKLFLEVDDPVRGIEIWTSDGTSSGTVLLKDINPSTTSRSTGFEFIEYNGHVFFAGSDVTGNMEMWMSDGTTTGTTQLIDINPSGGSSPRTFIIFNNKLFFVTAPYSGTNAELWQTDGTTSGTVKIAGVGSNTTPGFSILYKHAIVYNNKIYFYLHTAINGTIDLWESDGTAAGTKFFRENLRPITVYNNTLLLAQDSLHYYSLWKTDGTIGGTGMLAMIDTTF